MKRLLPYFTHTIIFLLGCLIGAGLLYSFAPTSPDAGEVTNNTGVMVERYRQMEGASDSSKYTNDTYGFSLTYPNEYVIKSFDEGSNSNTIVFQKPGKQEGFQIFITPYKEKEITKERLELDVRGGSILEPTDIILGDGTPALMFWSNDPLLGKLREVWFIHHGYLFEVITYAEGDGVLGDIMKTWSFSSPK